MLLALLTWTLGYHLLLGLNRLSVRGEMHRMIRAGMVKEATGFVFPSDSRHLPAGFAWEDEDEFSFNGKMFDVVEKKIEGDRMIVKAIADEKETAVLAKISASWKENEKDNRIRSGLMQLLSNLYVDTNESVTGLIKPPTYHSISFEQGLPRPLKLIPTPPPQYSC